MFMLLLISQLGEGLGKGSLLTEDSDGEHLSGACLGGAGAPEWMTVLAGMGRSILLAWSWTRSLFLFTSAYLPVNCSECSNLWKLLLLLGTAGPVLAR